MSQGLKSELTLQQCEGGTTVWCGVGTAMLVSREHAPDREGPAKARPREAQPLLCGVYGSVVDRKQNKTGFPQWRTSV